jgi:predicted alpha/beta superfamily hydrolase
MPRISIAALAIVQIAAQGPSRAVAQTTPAVQLPHSELHELLTSDGTQYELYIALIDGDEPDGDVEYPVLYLPDASIAFAAVVQMYRLMYREDELPSMILVGIDRPVGSQDEQRAKRALDLTPTRSTQFEQFATERYEREVLTGGADAFLAVLTEEVIPWVEARYPTSGERGLAGYSLSGLFATHVLLSSPTSFTHYLIGSPSVWWDNGVMFEREKEYASTHEDLPARVFLSAGTEEPFMLQRMLRLAIALAGRDYPGLELKRFVVQDETHTSGVFPTMSRGLRFLFGGVD